MTSEKPAERSLFVWRSGRRYEGLYNVLPVRYRALGHLDSPDIARLPCLFCNTLSDVTGSADMRDFDKRSELLCRACGFFAAFSWDGGQTGDCFGNDFIEIECYEVARLKELELSSSEIGLDELGTHLRRNIRDIYGLAPRRFEELVEDVFINLGYGTRLSRQTRDGGFDILLEDCAGGQILVECKRYARHRKIRVSAVRELLGVQLRKGVRFGKLIATTVFTEPAREEAVEVREGESGFQLDLVDIEEFAHHLDIYNSCLPPRELVRRFSDRHP